LAGPAAAQSPHTHDHSFSGAENWAQVFDDPKRDEQGIPTAWVSRMRESMAQLIDVNTPGRYWEDALPGVLRNRKQFVRVRFPERDFGPGPHGPCV